VYQLLYVLGFCVDQEWQHLCEDGGGAENQHWAEGQRQGLPALHFSSQWPPVEHTDSGRLIGISVGQDLLYITNGRIKCVFSVLCRSKEEVSSKALKKDDLGRTSGHVGDKGGHDEDKVAMMEIRGLRWR
jgi:hypothetical protein